jgi:hypothetical protein
MVLALPGGAQYPSSQRAGSATLEAGEIDAGAREKQLRLLNDARQKSLVSDADKLLKLASELKSEVDQNNPDSLTPAQLRKVAEIEKLAHSVKVKMSTSVRGAQDFLQPPAAFQEFYRTQ